MAGYLNKYHIGIDSNGYILSHARDGQPYYQKKRAPTFVNKFGSGDSSYRDATFWQFWASTNWRNGSKQLRADDPGKFWKSSDINITQLDEITLSRALTLVGQTAAGVKVNAISAWRTSQSWWNASYGYRQQLTVTAPATQVPVGYPVKISVDTAVLQTAGKLLANRNDWRVVYFNGTTLVDLMRDYIDTTNTYFALQSAIPANTSDSNYYIYYGYSGESTSKQPSSESDWNSVYGLYGTTPDANTVALFHFREGTGTTTSDDSSSSNNGAMTSVSWATGEKFGRAASFGGGGYIDIGSHSSLNLGSMTLETWVKTNNAGSTQQIVNKRASSVVGYELLFSGSKVRFAISDSGGEKVLLSATTIVTGTQYHVAATHDGSTMKIYINGVLDNSMSAGTPLSQNGSVIIGAQADGSLGQKLDGKLSQFRISNTARTSFPYVLSSEPTTATGSEISTQPPSSSADMYAGCSDGKLYKWDGTSTFTEQFDTSRVTWYDSGNDDSMIIGDSGGTERAQAQSFQLATATNIQTIELFLKKNAGTPGDITIRIETNNAGVPSGTLVNAALTGTITAFTGTTLAWKSLTFASSVQLSASTTYWLVAKTAAAANDNSYVLAADSTSPTYSSGNLASSADGGSTWSADTSRDAMFRINGESTSINDILVTSIGGTLKMLLATGAVSSQTNGNARIYSFDGTNYALEKTFATATESQVTKLAEFNSKLYAGVGPQAKVYEGTNPTTWTISKDIDVPSKPGYIYALKEYNGSLYAGGGSPEFLYDKHYGGFWYRFDGTTWSNLYPFDFTEIRSFEFYDAFLFGTTYHGHIYVYDTATLNPLFNFKDGYDWRQSIIYSQLFDDKIYFLLYPQEGSNDTNAGIWLFDRHGLSLAHTKSGVTGFRCAAVVNNILFIGTGDNGNIYKIDPDNYATQGYVQTSYFDANLPSIDKLYNAVVIQHDPLVAGQSVVVYYKFKESDSWTTLGTSNTIGDTSKSLSFVSGVYSKKISIKVEFNTTNTSVAPKVKECVLQYTLYPVRKWLWTMRIKAKKSLQLLDRTTDSNTATQIRSNLEGSQNGYKLVTFVDIDSTSYTVLFSEIDQSSWVVNQNDVNEDEIAISLLEA